MDDKLDDLSPRSRNVPHAVAPGIRERQMSKVLVRQRAPNQKIRRLTFTKVRLDEVAFDVKNEFDLANCRFVAKEPGYYLVIAALAYQAPEAGYDFWVMVTKNGDADAAARYVEAQQPHISAENACAWMKAQIVLQLAAADYLEVWTYHRSPRNTEVIAVTTSTAGGNRAHTYLNVAQLQ